MVKRGKCLASQGIRRWIKEGKLIVPSFDEDKIESSAFEPTIGDKIFRIDTDIKGMVRTRRSETVYRTLLENLTVRQREEIDISNGWEIKKGYTYLIPLEERVKLGANDFVRASPRSSYGRLFLNTRMMADYNLRFDEVDPAYKIDTPLQLWLMVQPLAFNLIIYPGLSLNQIRCFDGLNARLDSFEILEEFEKNPLLYLKEGKDLIPAKPIVRDDALQLHLDLSGQFTEGVIGLKARHNDTPIDLKKIRAYEAEDFFEPILQNTPKAESGEYYLFASKEILKIPKHLNSELLRTSDMSFHGPFHFAGFIGNGFEGDLVFEVRSDEIANIELVNGMPISSLKFCRTEIPDKGGDANYIGQVGPYPSKYFKVFDFKFAARNYAKLDRIVLVHDANILNRFRKKGEGFEMLSSEKAAALYKEIKQGFWHSRYDCEIDELILQPIPYALCFGPNGKIFTYIKSENIEDYGEARLFGKHSIGVGGHIIKKDAPDYIINCLKRELNEEIEIIGETTGLKLLGTLLAYDKPVDRVHFGIIFALHVNGRIKGKESSLHSGRMVDIEQIAEDPSYDKKYETWSRILIPYLPALYRY